MRNGNNFGAARRIVRDHGRGLQKARADAFRTESPEVQSRNPSSRYEHISTRRRVQSVFSTSGYDSTILGMTQISMLNADKKGSPVCGDNEPVVVQRQG